MFTSDHGDIEGTFTTYDRGARQPCLARLPGHTESRGPCDDLVSNVDLAPTLFDLAGVDPGPEYTVDGRSFLPLLTGQGEYEYYPAYFERDQLYDLDADPEEQHNLADDQAHADRLREYSADLPHEFGEFTRSVGGRPREYHARAITYSAPTPPTRIANQ